ncbi:MAG: MBL fold metallo-hydrolase RNA specificity domain-containing protein [Desulfatirhabdiaceae bacterium]
MNVTFYGGVREVTGSMHLVTGVNDHILMDCGMIQGRRKESEARNKSLPFHPGLITNAVLSHAHIDHSGRIPILTQNGFKGRIVCTRATADACRYLLMDSAHIQESDAKYLNYKTVRNLLYQMKASPKTQNVSKKEKARIQSLLKEDHNVLNTAAIEDIINRYGLARVEPLYTKDDAERALGFFDGYPYEYPISVGRDTSVVFYDAGHILGSSITVIRTVENQKKFTIVFTGDIGRFDMPILENPTLNFAEEDRDVDLMIMESTYGNRIHEPTADLKPSLKNVLNETWARGGSLIIPAFAYGRTQDILYRLHELFNEKAVPRLPVYVDSPLATQITRVFGEHPEVFDSQTHKTFLEKGQNPFSFDQVNFVSSVEDSMALMREERPHIVIAGSGMCEAGRILHHLRYKIHNPKNTILIVGFMAENTLGRRIQEKGLAYEESGRSGPPPLVRFLNKDYPVKAHVVRLGGFSAHGDQAEMTRFLKESNLNIKKIAIVHGEEEQSLAFEKHLTAEGFSATVPMPGEIMTVG